MKYTVILQRESDGGYVATVPGLPGCVSEVLKNIEEAIELYRKMSAKRANQFRSRRTASTSKSLPPYHEETSDRPPGAL